MLERGLAADPLGVHERPVEAAEIAQDPVIRAVLDDAVLFRDDLIEQLDRIVRVAPERIHRSQIDRLLAFGGLQDQASHRSWEITQASAPGQSLARELPAVEVEGRTIYQDARAYNDEFFHASGLGGSPARFIGPQAPLFPGRRASSRVRAAAVPSGDHGG